jgi:putative phage-type endonuclease
MKLVDIEQGTAAWHFFRQNGIGASEASVLLGINPWKKIDSLFFEKLGEGKPIEDNANMARGRELEPIARKLFEDRMEMKFSPACAIHNEYDFIRASFDGINLEEQILIEIKAPGEKTHAMANSGQIPAYYMSQIQWQLLVSGFHIGYYVSYYNEELISIEVLADYEMHKTLIEKAKWFWQCVLDRNPPTNPSSKEIELLFENYEFLYQQISTLEKELDLVKQTLESKVEKGKTVSWNGYTAKWAERKGPIDYTQIEYLKKLDLEIYRKSTRQYFEIRAPREK